MRKFDGNLNAYHALNALNELYTNQVISRYEEATTQEEKATIMKEADAHWDEQGKVYEELGEEMGQIMGKRWWQFWK